MAAIPAARRRDRSPHAGVLSLFQKTGKEPLRTRVPYQGPTPPPSPRGRQPPTRPKQDAGLPAPRLNRVTEARQPKNGMPDESQPTGSRGRASTHINSVPSPKKAELAPTAPKQGSPGLSKRIVGLLKHPTPQRDSPRAPRLARLPTPDSLLPASSRPPPNKTMTLNRMDMSLQLSSLSKSSPVLDTFDDARAEEQRKREKLRQFGGQCNEILPGLFLGGDDAARNKELLKQNGVTHVLNCAGISCENYFPTDFKYERLFLTDAPQENFEAILYPAIEFLLGNVAPEEGRRTLVHCQQGVSRSTSACISYVMVTKAMTYDQAYALVRERRPIVRPNIGFMCQLLEWERRLKSGVTAEKPIVYVMGPLNQYAPSSCVPNRVKEVSRQSLKSDTCAVLQAKDGLFVWVGSNSTPTSRGIAEYHANLLQRYEHAPKMEVVFENSEPPQFWACLESKPLPSRPSLDEEVEEVSQDSSSKSTAQVTLLGELQPDTWHTHVTPQLKAAGIEFLLPNQSPVHAPVSLTVLYVVSSQHRAVVSLLQAVELVSVTQIPESIYLAVPPLDEHGNHWAQDEVFELNLARETLRGIARRVGVRLFDTVDDAVSALVQKYGAVK